MSRSCAILHLHTDSQSSPENLPHSYAADMTGRVKMGNANRVIIAVDVRGNDRPEWDMTSPVFAPPSNRQLYTHKPRHIFYEHPAGTLNCLFDDGHVKAMKPLQTLTPTNFWTRDNTPFVGPSLQSAQAILRHAGEE